MRDASFLAVLLVGFILGLKHATDADHVVAVTTFAGEDKRLSRACAIGLFWGLGHTLSLSVMGMILIGLRIPMSEWLAQRLEFGVAIMLVVLGARVIATVHRRSHGQHRHFNWTRFGVRPMLVGVVHGAAGSAALTLLLLTTISSPLRAMVYIVVFGAGTIVGMLVISLLVSLPFVWAKTRFPAVAHPIQMGAGALSCALGLYLGVTLWQGLS